MIIQDCVLFVEGVQEKKSKNDKTFHSGKFSSGGAFDYPTYLLCNKVVPDGFYHCAVKIEYSKERNTNNISVAIGDALGTD